MSEWKFCPHCGKELDKMVQHPIMPYPGYYYPYPWWGIQVPPIYTYRVSAAVGTINSAMGGASACPVFEQDKATPTGGAV